MASALETSQLAASVDPAQLGWSDARLRPLLAALPAPIWTVDSEGRLLDLNPAALRLLEADSGARVLGLPVETLVHPDDRAGLATLQRQALADRGGHGEFRLLGPQGNERWIECDAAPLKAAGGAIEAALFVLRDVTERRQTDAALIAALRRNATILASSGEGIQGFDADGTLAFINEAALSMLGYAEHELHGRQLHALLHHHRPNGEIYPSAECPIYLTLRDGKTRTIENEVFFRKDGSSFPVEYTVAAILDGGRPTGAVLNFRNITRKRRYAELRELEGRVLEMVGAGTALPDVLHEIAATADRLLPAARCSVLLVDAEGRLQSVAAPRLPSAYGDVVNGLPIGPVASPCGTSAWRREQVIVPDIVKEPQWESYWHLAREFGVRACWSTPILDAEGQVLATFAIYYSEPRAPDQAEQEMISWVTKYVRTAIERHRTVEALRVSEERLRTLAENVQEVFWISSPDKQRLLYVSPAYEKIWGRTSAGLYADARQWMAAIHPEDLDRVREAASRQAEGGYAEEYRVVRSDGTIRWVSDRAFPVRGADGDIRQIVGSARDITSRKLAELALGERLKELNCLYRVSSLVSNHARPVESICQDVADALPPAMLHAAGAVARIELGKEVYLSPGWQPPLATLDAPVLRGGVRVGRIEVGYLGQRPDADAGRGPFLHEEAAMIDTIAVHVGDMLNHREIAQRLTESERLNAIGQLTGGVAHDFNNLLTVILGNAEMLAEGLADQPLYRELAVMTTKAAERGAELTSRLLAFARRQPLDPQVQDINRQVAGMEGLLRRTLGEHVDIRLLLASGLRHALVDPGQLESALLNLCINARDAMPAGGRLTIETANVDLDAADVAGQRDVEPGPYVMVSVADTGVGMDQATQERAFEPFFTTKDVGKGSGLGLSMVYGFAKQSKGHVRIFSEPGMGTTVKLYLPRAREADDAAGSGGRAAAAAMQQGSERILLVEDDDLVRAHVRDQLRTLGYEVEALSSGAEALALLESGRPFDLLFTDVVMPGGLSGRQLAEAVRRLRPALPVLFTSGYTEQAAAESGRLERGVHLLQKPYRRQELAAKVRALLDAGGAR